MVKVPALHRELGIPALAVVENFASFSCPEYRRYGPLGVARGRAAYMASADEDAGRLTLPMDAALADANSAV